MAKRIRLASGKASEGGAYFAPPCSTPCWSSGCTLLDCVLAGHYYGGYALGRVINIVGDKSTGKTLLAIEAATNFAQCFPKGRIRYREVEAAFDEAYAGTLGLPLDRVEFPVADCFTVENVFNDMVDFIGRVGSRSGLYILDSLDALSDKDELVRPFGEPSYDLGKAKAMSQLFRRLIQKLAGSKISVIIISQVRANIGVKFGRKTTRSGGRALDFYASQVLWLSQLQRIKKTVKGITRPVGILVRAHCEKNKIAFPFRECQFPIMFGYGIDDVGAGLDWLTEVKHLEILDRERVQPSRETVAQYYKKIRSLPSREYQKEREFISKGVAKVWQEIEGGFLPARRKY